MLEVLSGEVDGSSKVHVIRSNAAMVVVLEEIVRNALMKDGYISSYE